MCVYDLSASPPLSMGGAIAARAAAGGVVKSLAGLVVIDVVEGEGSFTPVLPPSFVSFPLSPLSPPSYSVSFPSLFALAVPLPPSSSHPPTHSPLAPIFLLHPLLLYSFPLCPFLHLSPLSGTAIDSLGSMQGLLRDRPSQFKSLDTAVEWRCVSVSVPQLQHLHHIVSRCFLFSIRSGQLRNVESARVSMPGQVRR